VAALVADRGGLVIGILLVLADALAPGPHRLGRALYATGYLVRGLCGAIAEEIRHAARRTSRPR
jgi:hypothetical protein